jgi:hypothetical protein
MQDEKLSAGDACDAVLRENLHGLELDQRCTQIAAFALALTAWKFTGGFRPLPPLNIACSGLGVNARKEDWLALANGDTRLRSGLEQLYDLFQKAPELGSLINPRQLAHGDLVTASFTEIQPLLTRALQSDKAKRNDDLNEIGVAARGMASAANLLGGDYCLIVTNVPYLLRRKQGKTLQKFCSDHYSDSTTDLATVFVRRCYESCSVGGTAALVTPHNWLFLGSYHKLRKGLLNDATWNWLAKLGENAFESPQAAGAFAALIAVSRSQSRKGHTFWSCNSSIPREPKEKAQVLRTSQLCWSTQESQLANPDSRIASQEGLAGDKFLSEYASSSWGVSPADLARYGRCFWELSQFSGWRFWQSSVEDTTAFGGRQLVLWWNKDFLGAVDHGSAYIRGESTWNKQGVVVSVMREMPCTLFTGEPSDLNVAIIVPKHKKHLQAIWAFCSSPAFNVAVRRIDQALKVTSATLVKVPFDLGYWQRVAAEKYPHGLPEPASNDPTQWLFAGHPSDSTAPLQVAVARLLGYRWPRQTGQTVSGALPVPDDGLEELVDEDGIVCIPSVRGEQPAADRLRELLIKAYGKKWSPAQQDELLAAVGFEGRTLEDWLRNGFFEQHCKCFHHRPFIWQVWDGRKDGFSALVNYHKLDYRLLEKLTYTYLGEWIKKQQDAVANEEGGADDRLVKARQLQDKLKLILEGEAPYDIFVRWKPLEQQPIGWHPDLNDGVRLNIRPFIEADVLRKCPNIKWGKDRGKNPPGSPWGEERDNDQHFALEEKRKAK